MCGRYAVTTDPARLAAEIEAINEVKRSVTDPVADEPPTLDLDGIGPTGSGSRGPGVNYNVAPTTSIMAVVKRHDRPHADSATTDADESDGATLRIRAMRWGLVPAWSKDDGQGAPAKGPVLFNARAETAREKSSFRASARSRRCLIPMDGWYEWKPGPPGANGKPTKIPYFMSPKDRTRVFMAGLWSVWRPKGADPETAPLLSATILTTEAVGMLREVHDRMPLIMPRQDWDAWLDPDHPAPDILYARPPAPLADAIDIREVSPLVNRVANNGPELLNPL